MCKKKQVIHWCVIVIFAHNITHTHTHSVLSNIFYSYALGDIKTNEIVKIWIFKTKNHNFWCFLVFVIFLCDEINVEHVTVFVSVDI